MPQARSPASPHAPSDRSLCCRTVPPPFPPSARSRYSSPASEPTPAPPPSHPPSHTRPPGSPKTPAPRFPATAASHTSRCTRPTPRPWSAPTPAPPCPPGCSKAEAPPCSPGSPPSPSAASRDRTAAATYTLRPHLDSRSPRCSPLDAHCSHGHPPPASPRSHTPAAPQPSKPRASRQAIVSIEPCAIYYLRPAASDLSAASRPSTSQISSVLSPSRARRSQADPRPKDGGPSRYRHHPHRSQSDKSGSPPRQRHISLRARLNPPSSRPERTARSGETPAFALLFAPHPIY